MGREGTARQFEAPGEPTERHTKPTPYNTNPLHWVRRQIRSSTEFDAETKSHVLLWLESIKAMVGDDPRQLALAQSACIAYAQCVRLTVLALSIPPESKEAVNVANLLVKWQGNLARSLRTAGIQGPGEKGPKGKKPVFQPPPRPKSPTETAAEQVA